jgi:membrane associated rhomboid family serine protease
MKKPKESDFERRRLLISLVFPLLFVFVFWLIKIVEISLDISLANYGLRPREISQWFGIITMPFLHSGFSHLFANTTSFLVLGTLLFYFHNKYSLQILGWSWLLTGVLTWIIGRSGSVHIGASGIIYAFAGFIFVSGVLSKNIRFMAISLIVVFMYGSMIWGIIPQGGGISWEGHLAGLISGICLSYFYRIPIQKSTEEFDEDEKYVTSCSEDYNIFYEFKDNNKQK